MIAAAAQKPTTSSSKQLISCRYCIRSLFSRFPPHPPPHTHSQGALTHTHMRTHTCARTGICSRELCGSRQCATRIPIPRAHLLEATTPVAGVDDGGGRTACCHSGDPKFSVVVQDLHVHLGKTSERRPVLKGLNLSVKRGSLHMLLGPNGCGKSTLLRVLGGLVNPGRGTVRIDQPSGFVFQNPDHQVVMPTVAADVAFGLGRWVE